MNELIHQTGPGRTQRFMSVDALRGFDMFWIIGADSLVHALNGTSLGVMCGGLVRQLSHSNWEGFTFYDLIFPLFIFLAGVSSVFSLTSMIEREGRAAALKRIFRRSFLLLVCGVIYNGGLASRWPDIRLMGVLQLIGIAYGLTGILLCFCRPRILVTVCAVLLAGHWALLSFVPVRDIQLDKSALIVRARAQGDDGLAKVLKTSGNWSATKDNPAWAATEEMFHTTTNFITGSFAPGCNVASHFDFEYLPGRKHDVFWDSEGLLTPITATAMCLFGVFAGFLLRNNSVPDARKVIILLAAGLIAAGIGWLWAIQLPVIKRIWTSSYVLLAGGYSAMLLALFYLLLDVWKRRALCQPFVWLGTNSIAIYLAANFLGGFEQLAARLVGGDPKSFVERHFAAGYGGLLVSLVGLVLAFCFVHFLYKQKIFLRL